MITSHWYPLTGGTILEILKPVWRAVAFTHQLKSELLAEDRRSLRRCGRTSSNPRQGGLQIRLDLMRVR